MSHWRPASHHFRVEENLGSGGDTGKPANVLDGFLDDFTVLRKPCDRKSPFQSRRLVEDLSLSIGSSRLRSLRGAASHDFAAVRSVLGTPNAATAVEELERSSATSHEAEQSFLPSPPALVGSGCPPSTASVRSQKAGGSRESLLGGGRLCAGRSRWRKVLYERQPFEDNYVDPVQFLEDLRENEHMKTYLYGDVVNDTFAIVQQLSIVVLFVMAFFMVLAGNTSEYMLASIDVGILAVAIPFHMQCRQENSLVLELVDFGRQAVIVTLMLILLSPALRTLTLTFSNDTIVALSIITMSLHVLLTDYNYMNGYTEEYQQNLAVNAATLGTILMASRIQSPLQSGALITFGILCFSLSPILRHKVRKLSFTTHVAFTFTLCGLVAGCLIQFPVLAAAYVVVVLTIAFVIPWFFVLLHETFKWQIHGPWDEARPTNSAAAAEWANAGLLL